MELYLTNNLYMLHLLISIPCLTSNRTAKLIMQYYFIKPLGIPPFYKPIPHPSHFYTYHHRFLQNRSPKHTKQSCLVCVTDRWGPWSSSSRSRRRRRRRRRRRSSSGRSCRTSPSPTPPRSTATASSGSRRWRRAVPHRRRHRRRAHLRRRRPPVRRLAAALRRAPLGLRRGGVVMSLVRNSPEFVLSFFAASRVGAAVTTANPMSTPHEIESQLAAAGATVVITESMAADKLPSDITLTVVLIDERRDGCLHFWDDLMSEDEASPLAGDENDDEDEKVFDPDDVVALPYSSGTTGLPKGVMLTHRSLSTSVAQQVDGENPNIGLHAGDVILCALPMFHIYSLNTIMMCGLRVGAAIVVMRRFDLAAMMDLVERHRVTIAPLVPPIVVAVAKSEAAAARDLSSVRMVLSGAAPMGKDIEDAFMAKLPGAVLGQVQENIFFPVNCLSIFVRRWIIGWAARITC